MNSIGSRRKAASAYYLAVVTKHDVLRVGLPAQCLANQRWNIVTLLHVRVSCCNNTHQPNISMSCLPRGSQASQANSATTDPNVSRSRVAFGLWPSSSVFSVLVLRADGTASNRVSYSRPLPTSSLRRLSSLSDQSLLEYVLAKRSCHCRDCDAL